MRRRSVIAALAVGLVIVGAAAYLALNQGMSEPQAVTLHVVGEDYSPMQGLEQLSSRFTKETGIGLEIIRVDAETLRKRYLAEFQAGADTYDVIMAQGFDIGLLAVNNWTLDVDEAMTRPGWRDAEFDLGSFSDELLDLSSRYQGRLVGLPCSAQSMFLWYRKDLFSDPGERESFAQHYGYPLPQPVPQRSMTWSQYRDVAEFFTRKKGELAAGKPLAKDLFGAVVQGKNHIALWFEFQNYLRSFGGDFIASDGHTVQAADAPAREALEFYLGLLQFSPPGSVNYTWDEALAAFQNGQLATAVMWSDSISAVEDPDRSQVAGRVGYTANPTLEAEGRSASVFGGWGLFVNRNSRHPQEAFKLIQWVNRPDIQIAWAEVGGIPAALSAYDSPELRGIAGMAAHRQALTNLVAWTREPFSARLVEVGQNNLAKAVAGEVPPEAALEEIAERYREIIEEAQ